MLVGTLLPTPLEVVGEDGGGALLCVQHHQLLEEGVAGAELHEGEVEGGKIYWSNRNINFSPIEFIAFTRFIAILFM